MLSFLSPRQRYVIGAGIGYLFALVVVFLLSKFLLPNILPTQHGNIIYVNSANSIAYGLDEIVAFSTSPSTLLISLVCIWILFCKSSLKEPLIVIGVTIAGGFALMPMFGVGAIGIIYASSIFWPSFFLMTILRNRSNLDVPTFSNGLLLGSVFILVAAFHAWLLGRFIALILFSTIALGVIGFVLRKKDLESITATQ